MSLRGTPPFDAAAEETVLGACLASESALDEIAEILEPGDFFRPSNRVIFDSIKALVVASKPVDPVSVADDLSRRGRLEEVGGRPYVVTLLGEFGTVGGAAHAARIIAQLAILRRLASVASEIHEEAMATPEDPDALLDSAEQRIFDIAGERVTRSTRKLRELLSVTALTLEERANREMRGVPSGSPIWIRSPADSEGGSWSSWPPDQDTVRARSWATSLSRPQRLGSES